MAKQQVIDKRVLGVTGTLYRDEETNELMIRVETKETVKDYNLVKDFLEEMEGSVITVNSELDSE